MNILSKISPPATLLLLSTSARMRSLLKLTLMDLVLKGVLKLEIKHQELEQARRKIAVWYVCQGRNFERYRPPKPYELIFLQPFYEEPIRVTFRDLVRVAFRNARGIDLFKRSVIKSEGIEQYVTRSFWKKLYGGHSLTKEGIGLQKQLISHLADVDRNMNHFFQTDPKSALHLLINLRGNILLLKNVQFKLIESLDYQQLVQQYQFDYSADWKFYESMFFEKMWLDFFDLSITEF
ncbi:MAG: hypothetical protein HKN92_05065 [Chitinophagales bacterium]|nr:hypothetical protein [Chitinophagales bacterium]